MQQQRLPPQARLNQRDQRMSESQLSRMWLRSAGG